MIFGWVSLQNKTWAGQYITEDPEITAYEHIELIPFASVYKISPFKYIQVPAVEMNMGVHKDLEAHIILPAAIIIPKQKPTHYGCGDIETGLKYLLLAEKDWVPALAFYPKVSLPAGDMRLGLGFGGAFEQFPLWFEKNWGSWKLTGGGGYTLTQAPMTKDYWFGGYVLQKEVLPKELTFGGELYAQGNIGQGIKKSLILTLGGNYNFTPTFAFVCSVGRSIAGQNTFTGYIGFDIVVGP